MDPTKPLVVKTETTPLISSSAPAPSNRVMGRTDHDTVQLQSKDVITVVAESAACIATCGLFGLCGMYTVGPRETILTLHNGRLTGIESQPGCHWAAACCRSMRAVTTQDIVWNMPLLKMLDIKGVPIQVSAILVYRVVDAKKAALDIDDYNSFVRSLSTAALKQVVQRYTYDELKVEARAISEQIVAELQTRVVVAGAQARVPLAPPRACDDDTQSNASFSQLEGSDDDPLSSEHAPQTRPPAHSAAGAATPHQPTLPCRRSRSTR